MAAYQSNFNTSTQFIPVVSTVFILISALKYPSCVTTTTETITRAIENLVALN